MRIRIVALFYPDESIFLKEPKPAFLDEYSELFDPTHTHYVGIYGFSRMDSAVALTYDATNVLLHALPATGTPITTQNIMAGLINTADDGAWQGVTGQINFSNGTVPYKKAIVILSVDANDKFHMVMLASGCYEKKQCPQTSQATPPLPLARFHRSIDTFFSDTAKANS